MSLKKKFKKRWRKKSHLFFIFNSATWAILTSCAVGAKKEERILSSQEMQKYQLNGIVSDAKICPHKYDELAKALVLAGPCEFVTCSEANSKIICKARPEKN